MDFLIIVVIFAVGGILLYICITPLQKSQMIRDREKAQAEAWAKARLKEVKEKEERQDALARQKSLEDKFFNSPLTRKIIEAISDGTGRLPEEITIYDDRVTGRTNGQMRTFDFAANRVPFLEEAYVYTYKRDEVDFLLKPQIALGNAINRILNGQYEIHDEANYKVITRTDSDGEFHHLYEYISDHVLLRLKATNQW